MTTFLKNPYFNFFLTVLYYTHCQGTALQPNKFLLRLVTYINITETKISNYIIKQYYGLIKTFKVLVIVKKKQFSGTNILL